MPLKYLFFKIYKNDFAKLKNFPNLVVNSVDDILNYS